MSKLLSVIIPVYNSERYLEKAINSALKSTYNNIEIIVINDGSLGNFEEVVSLYQNNSKIRFIYHEKNRGLFRARITGIQQSNGDYIAFLDSDDWVSVDWYRSLIEKLESTEADMVIGDFNLHYADKDTFFSRSILRKTDINLVGKEVQDTFFQQAGLDYSWHIGCNKVYTRHLITQAIKMLDSIDDHIVMCEDVLFSCIFYTLAQKVTNCHNNYYFYNKDVNSFTVDINNAAKHVDSIVNVFNKIRALLSSNKKMDEYTHYINLWQDRVLYFWKNASKDNIKVHRYIESKMLNKNFDYNNDKELYYYHEENVSQYKFEEIKEKIIKCDVISFDVFDTLLLRPFLSPTDLFSILEDYVNKRLKTIDSIHFKTIRIEAEIDARRSALLFNKNNQEITLDDIYEKIASITNFDKKILEEIKAREIELELRYLYRRHSGYELYSMAKHLGKKIIITSDMYLSKDVIQTALIKNGYTDIDAFFVSSEFNLTKDHGELYKYIKQIYPNKHILHGGDNYHSDVEMPKKFGIDSFHLPKAVDLLEGKIPNVYSGTFFSFLHNNAFGMIKMETAYKFLGFRCALALIANRLFDNPFVTLSSDSDFNGDTVKIGYSILGMYTLANCLNLKDHSPKYDTILFYARDGFLIKKAFDHVINVFNLPIRSEYCHISRKSVIPLFISKPEDLYSLIEFFGRHDSLEDVLKVLTSISKYDYMKSLKVLKKLINFDISNHIGWTKFLTIFAENLYSQEKVDAYHVAAQKYFSKICVGKCASFDVGYSFRSDYLLKKRYGYDITPYVVHINDEYPFMRAENANMRWHSILNYTPIVSGSFRETCISELGPSCLGYSDAGIPIMEEYTADAPSCFELRSLHNAAEQFVIDYLAFFSDQFHLMRVRYFDLCFPFEIFNTQARASDRGWIKNITFEDDLCSGSKINLLDFWNRQTTCLTPQYKNCVTKQTKKIFFEMNKFFMKYYLYKMLSKVFSGKRRKKFMSRKDHYKSLISKFSQ